MKHEMIHLLKNWVIVCLTGSGRNWIDHLIEMSTGTQTTSWHDIANGIVSLDHFLDDGQMVDKTDRGLQIKLGYSYQMFYQHQ